MAEGQDKRDAVDRMAALSGKVRKADNAVINVADLLDDNVDLALTALRDALIDKLDDADIIRNEDNGRQAVLVDTQSIESTHTEVIDEAKSEHTLVSPAAGNRLVIHDVFLHAGGNMGEVKLDAGDKAVARLYTSQFLRASFTNMTVRCEVDEDLQITGGEDNGADLFVAINYVEINGD